MIFTVCASIIIIWETNNNNYVFFVNNENVLERAYNPDISQKKTVISYPNPALPDKSLPLLLKPSVLRVISFTYVSHASSFVICRKFGVFSRIPRIFVGQTAVRCDWNFSSGSDSRRRYKNTGIDYWIRLLYSPSGSGHVVLLLFWSS